MKVQRVYPMTVSLSPMAGHLQGIKSHTPPLEIRPVLPGAQVTPSHYEMETTGSTPAFYVTPLARGKLADARLEVYSHGRLVQEIPLPMKGTRQRLTWILLFLAVLIPLGLYYFTRQVDLSTTGAKVPAPAVHKAQAQLEEEDLSEGPAVPPETLEKAMKKNLMPGMGGTAPEGIFTKKAASSKRGGNVDEAQPQEPKSEFVLPPKPKGTLEAETLNVLPDFGRPTKWLGAQVQEGYDWARSLAVDLYLSFYLGLGLLALAIISWVFHAGRRSSRRGQPIALGA
jgi:hypothetical protein